MLFQTLVFFLGGGGTGQTLKISTCRCTIYKYLSSTRIVRLLNTIPLRKLMDMLPTHLPYNPPGVCENVAYIVWLVFMHSRFPSAVVSPDSQVCAKASIFLCYGCSTVAHYLAHYLFNFFV